MEVVKLDFIKVKGPMVLIQNKEQEENITFNIKVFFGAKDLFNPTFKYIFAIIKNDRCKCWTNIYHTVIEHFLQSGESDIKIKRIKQYESGVSLTFSFPTLASEYFIQKILREKLKKIFKTEVFWDRNS